MYYRNKKIQLKLIKCKYVCIYPWVLGGLVITVRTVKAIQTAESNKLQ